MNPGTRFFLSLYDCGSNISRDRPAQKVQNDLLTALIGQGFAVFDSSTFSDYGKIFDEIESADFFVAIIDEYWTSSIWKMIELSYATGTGPERDRKFIARPKPCFVFSTTQNPNIDSLIRSQRVTLFDGSFVDLWRKREALR